MFFGTSVFAVDDDVRLDKSYIKLSSGYVRIPDFNNISTLDFDPTFASALYDIAYEPGISYQVVFGNTFKSFAVEISIDYIEVGLDSIKSDTLANYNDGDLSITFFLLNYLYHPSFLEFGNFSMYVGGGVGMAYRVDLDTSSCTGSRCSEPLLGTTATTFKSFTNENRAVYQYLIGGDYVLTDSISIFSELRNIFFDEVSLTLDSGKATYKNIDINPMVTTIGLKYDF